MQSTFCGPFLVTSKSLCGGGLFPSPKKMYSQSHLSVNERLSEVKFIRFSRPLPQMAFFLLLPWREEEKMPTAFFGYRRKALEKGRRNGKWQEAIEGAEPREKSCYVHEKSYWIAIASSDGWKKVPFVLEEKSNGVRIACQKPKKKVSSYNLYISPTFHNEKVTALLFIWGKVKAGVYDVNGNWIWRRHT